MTITAAHRLTVFLVAIWGYTALLLTGEFNAPILISAYIFAAAAYMFHLRNFTLPAWFWNVVSLVALVITMGMASRQLLDATVYLFTFLQIIKLFTARTANELRWCYVISLFHIIGASVLTTSMNFGMLFLGYILLMIFSLLLYTLRRESEATELFAENLMNRRATLPATRVTVPHFHTPWAASTPTPRGLVWTTALLSICVLIGTLATFAVVPRLQTQNLFQGYGKQPEKPSVSAFDESIEFGTFEKIQLDNAVAMYVQPIESEAPDHVRLRGVALDTFDGRAWRRTSQADYSTGMHTFTPFTTRLHPRTLRYRMIQPPGITNFLFADTFPDLLEMPREIAYYLDPFSGAAWLGGMFPKELQYTTESRLERLEDRRDPEEMPPDRPAFVLYPRRNWMRASPRHEWLEMIEARRAARQSETTTSAFADNATTGPLSAELDQSIESENEARAERHSSRANYRMVLLHNYLDRCTSIPVSLNIDRIKNLAELWTANERTSFAKTMAVERRFRTEFGYTLEPRSRGNFIEDFLFRTQEGHCEYFATSMAILCRHLGLPTRVVNGYYSVEWNAMGGNFTVRQRDAHSWVEVWLGNNYGWMTFDPTPPSGVGRAESRNPALLSLMRLTDALRVRWYRYVVDYSISDQVTIMRTLLKARDRLNQMFSRFQKLSPFSQDMSEEADGTVSDVNYLGIAGVVLVGVVLCAGAIAWFRRFRFGRRRRSDSVVRYYAELLRLLARQGFRLQPGQTPREFATQVADAPDLQLIVPITEVYYTSRYQGQDLSREQLELIAAFRKHLQRRQV